MGLENGKQKEGEADATAGLGDFRKLLGNYRLPQVDVAALFEWHRKDMEALIEANQKANEGIRALIERRQEILTETFAEWQAAAKNLGQPGTLSGGVDATKQGIKKAAADLRELTQLEVKAHADAWKVVQERMQENMRNLQKLLQGK